MRYSEAQIGRVFILRLEHGDEIPRVIEDFATQKGIRGAVVHFVGGADSGSNVVVGPEDDLAEKPVKVVTQLTGVNEAFGFGTIFTNEEGQAKLHMHTTFGRGGEVRTGCSGLGIKIWHIGEVILYELLTQGASRKIDPVTEFELLTLE